MTATTKRKLEAFRNRIAAKLAERGHKLEVSLEDFQRCITDSHPAKQLRPVISLSNNPECGTQRRRLEFLSPEEINYTTGIRGKEKIHETFSILPEERWRGLAVRRKILKAIGFL